MVRFLVLVFMVTAFVAGVYAQGPQLSDADLERIGRRIWQNEAAGEVSGLTAWNSGEDFPSLGIGHFIWYPAGQDGPFEESFPGLVDWLVREGVSVPGWLRTTQDCPWPNKVAFQKDFNSPRLKELRQLLAATVKQQTRYIVYRLGLAVPRLKQAAGQHGAQVETNINLLRQSAAGNFALIDYVNFKGEGTKATEQYNGQGWGLLQVLLEMKPATAATAPASFSEAAKSVLRRRVANSPASRNEKQWLTGWINRCESYKK